MISALFIFSTLLINNAYAFGTIGSRVAPSSYSTQPSARFSPLFVASADVTNGEPIPPMVKSIEAEMARAEKKRERYEAKLNEFKSKIQELEKRKMQYLEGSSLGKVEQNFTETTARSAVKAMMWRVIAGSVTLMTTLKFSGSLAYALKVVGSDFFSKAFTMFVGERLMNKSSAGRKGGADSAGRSIAKALIWRIFAIANTLTVCFFISKDFSMASKIAGSDAIFKTFLMVAYERVWAKIEWGKEYQVEFAI
jgi:uncharacterized membrane protein